MLSFVSIATPVSILFSTFSTPTLSAIYTLLIFVIGRLSADLMQAESERTLADAEWKKVSAALKANPTNRRLPF